MSSMNPQEYYENEENHGSYVYVTLEEMVFNFIANYTGDGFLIVNPSRSRVIYQFKQGIKKFSMNALREVKAVELELGDTLDISIPLDYINYTRISYVNPDSGDLMVLSENTKAPRATAPLQDNNADILFDNNGLALEGSTYFSELNDAVKEKNILGTVDSCSTDTDFRLDTTKNANGTFHIDTRSGKIHFSSDNAIRVIMLEYISDGLEYSNESDIKVSKMAEEALYNFVNYELMRNVFGIPIYEKMAANKSWESAYKNAKIALMNIKISDVMLCLNAKRKHIR